MTHTKLTDCLVFKIITDEMFFTKKYRYIDSQINSQQANSLDLSHMLVNETKTIGINLLYANILLILSLKFR